MRKFITATALAGAIFAGGTAMAGNPAPAPVDPQVIAIDTADTSGHILVPLLALIFFAAGLSS